ncbi:uncharacterized protein [Chlorocebus sabaeus]|uniref:uncharacterized protein n=1 Tax=Chlorocebus sabaeus TaxID=60711 RepID=UPI003BF987BC
MRGRGARGSCGSRGIRSCSWPGSRSGGGTARSSCSSSSTWSPFMKNLLLGLSRKMRLSQKIAYQVYQAMNTPGNFWLMRQLKDFGCHWGKKSELCSAHEDFMCDIIQDNKQYEKDIRIRQLKQLLEDSTSDEDGSSSSSSEDKEKHKKKKRKEKHKKRRKKRKRRKNRSTNLPSQMRVPTQSDKDVTCSTFSSQESNTVTKEQRKMQSEKVAG